MGRAKVKTMDGQEEELVQLSPLSCTCSELQEMAWPCQHIMAWDDRDNRDFSQHFHKCWKTSTLQQLYIPYVPVLMSNNLKAVDTCYPPPAAVKKGRHRVVPIEGGSGLRRPEALSLDEFIDNNGDLFVRYPLEDNSDLQLPVPDNAACEGRLREALRQPQGRKVGAQKLRCSKGKRVGHNMRTCHRFPPAGNEVVDQAAEEPRNEDNYRESERENRNQAFEDKQESQVFPSTAPPINIPLYDDSSESNSSSNGELSPGPAIAGD